MGKSEGRTEKLRLDLITRGAQAAGEPESAYWSARADEKRRH